MEGNGTSATAMLVGAPEDVGGRPDAASVTLAREEIEEALASDEPLELILTVEGGTTAPQDVRVAWERADLEKVLAGTDVGGITFSFDRAELYRALEHPDFEGHGIREMVMLTVAAASASAALAASTASGQPLADAPGSGPAATAVAPGHGEATTARDLAGVDVAIATAMAARDEAATASNLATPAIHDEAGAAARGIGQTVPGNDEAGLTARGVDVPIATAIAAHEATTARDLATPPIHDETGAVARGIGQTVPGVDEAGAAARGIDTQPAVAVGHDEASTASDLASVAAIHDETGAVARGIGQTLPGVDEASLAARGIDTAAVHDEATLVQRGIEAPAAPVDSGTSFEMPSVDSGTAAAIGGLAGAGLVIVGAAFLARRQRTTPA